MKNPFATPLDERIEIAAKKHATLLGDVEYHRLLGEYYLTERGKVDPHDSVADAYRFATMFEKWEAEQISEKRGHQLAADAKGQLNALVGCKKR